MADIFEEVDQALQQERMEKFWHDHKEKIVGIIIAILVFTAAYTGFKSWNNLRNGEETARLLEALSENNEQAVEEIAQDSRKGIQTVARFATAGNAVQNNNLEKAEEQYTAVIDNNPAPEMQDFARLLATKNDDTATLQYLKPVLADEKSPWHWHALLLAASIEVEQNNDYDKAIEYLNAFETNEQVSATLKQRAEAMRHIYVVKRNNMKTENNS